MVFHRKWNRQHDGLPQANVYNKYLPHVDEGNQTDVLCSGKSHFRRLRLGVKHRKITYLTTHLEHNFFCSWRVVGQLSTPEQHCGRARSVNVSVGQTERDCLYPFLG